jgi:branched-chain amino acid transport system ATP-binding protein
MVEQTGLTVRDLSKHFGGVQAVRGVSFSVQPGECVALIGPNGAGKSTTFACIAGQHASSAGQLLWNGEALDSLTPSQRLQRGIARTFQVAQTFEALTVLQNVQLLLPGAAPLNPFRALDGWQPQRARDLLARVGLLEQAALDARQLPYGAKKRLELAMALAGLERATGNNAGLAEARQAGLPLGQATVSPLSGLLLLDEPAAGLAAAERAMLMQLVHSLTRASPGQAGLAVLYTEHNMDAVFGIADRVLVLMEGRIAASGTAAEVAANELVRSHYLGRAFHHSGEGTHA